MLGNIYTSYNDLAATIAELAFRGGALRPVVSTVAIGGYSLADHLDRSASVSAIENSLITHVVMQQGPTETGPEAAELITSSGDIASRLLPRGVRAGLYVVWPHYSADISPTIVNYTAAATANSLELYPVGQAFRVIMEQHPEIVLHDPDLIRPSRAGSFLAAMVITAMLFDQDPNVYPNLFPAFITPDELIHLKAAAKYSIETFGLP